MRSMATAYILEKIVYKSIFVKLELDVYENQRARWRMWSNIGFVTRIMDSLDDFRLKTEN